MTTAILASPALSVLGAGALALLVTLLLTPAVIRIAGARGWVASPSADRWHETPTALMGGVSIFAGVAAGYLVFVRNGDFRLVASAAVLMFLVGAVDDRRGVSPVLKLLAQVVAAALLVVEGYTFDLGGNVLLSGGLTVFWVLGITNAVNLIDNMDGLSAGVSAIVALALAGLALTAGAVRPAAAVMAVCGATLGFLRYNFKPAKIFMGDCGSLFLGFCLAAFSVVVQAELGMRGIVAVFMTAMILGVPIMDTMLVTAARLLHNRPVSRGGRDHSSHRLVRSGLSERQAVRTLYAISAFFVLIAVLFYVAEVRVRVSVSIFALLAVGVFAVQIGSLEVYEKEIDVTSRSRRSWFSVIRILPRAIFGPRWKPALGVPVDALIVIAAFVLAHYLRFENGLTPERELFLVVSLPVVVLVRLPIFAYFGFYRAIWRHAGAYEIARVVSGVTAGSIGIYVALGVWHGFGGISNGVLVIEWMTVILGVLLSRFGLRGMRAYLGTVGTSGRHVAVYGADEHGARTIQLLRSHGHAMRPVAVVDENDEWRRRVVKGVPVAGGLDTLSRLREKRGVEELVLSDNHLSADERLRVAEACRIAGVHCTSLSVSVEEAGGTGEPADDIIGSRYAL